MYVHSRYNAEPTRVEGDSLWVYEQTTDRIPRVDRYVYIRDSVVTRYERE